jgi:STIP1 family protein 1
MEFKEKGNECLKKNDIEGAIQFYTMAIQEDNNQSIFYSNRAICYKNIGKMNEAMDDAQNAIEIDEKNIKAQFIMAICQLIKAQDDMSVKMVEKGEKRLRNAHGMCRAQKKDKYESDIQKNIYLSRKLKFKIQEIERLKNLEEFYQTSLEKITSDNSLNKTEKERKIYLLNKFIDRDRYDYEIPEYLKCELSGKLMMNPAITKSSNTFDKDNLIEYVKGHWKEPLSQKAMTLEDIYPNLAMKDAVETFLQKNPWAYDFKSKEDFFNNKINF